MLQNSCLELSKSYFLVLSALRLNCLNNLRPSLTTKGKSLSLSFFSCILCMGVNNFNVRLNTVARIFLFHEHVQHSVSVLFKFFNCLVHFFMSFFTDVLFGEHFWKSSHSLFLQMELETYRSSRLKVCYRFFHNFFCLKKAYW